MSVSRKLGNSFDYNIFHLERYNTETELRDEYRRFRNIAKKRLINLEKNDLLPRNTIESWRDVIADKPGELDKTELAMKLQKLNYFLESPVSTVRSARKKQEQYIETMHDKGYTFIDKTNVNDFIEFMQSTRDWRDSHSIGSPPVVELIEDTTNAGIPIEEVLQNFRFYLKNLDKIRKALERNDSKNPLSTKQIKEMLNRGKKNTSGKKIARRKGRK